jgi:hypothetical protein
MIAKITKLTKKTFTSESFANLVSFAAFVKGHGLMRRPLVCYWRRIRMMPIGGVRVSPSAVEA